MASPMDVSRSPTESRGTLRIGKMAEFRIDSRILRIPGSVFSFSFAPPIYGGFVYLSFHRWALVARGTSPGTPHGNSRSAASRKMAVLLLHSGILGVHGSAFCFLSSPPLLRRFRVFSIAAVGDGRQWPPPRNVSRNPTARYGAVKWGNCE